jgi:hypothetical protein
MKILGKYQAIIGIILVMAGLVLVFSDKLVFDEKEMIIGFLFGFAVPLLIDSIPCKE